jgi:branched-chain amino acid transport system ATP-binding protein
MTKPSSRPISERDATPMLAVDDLSVSYGHTRALRDVSIRVDTGEIVALVGVNGAGKSTLMGAISGLVKPLSGSIRLEGEPIGGLPAHAVARRGLALVPEGRDLFPDMSVEENLEMGAYLTRGAIGPDLDRVFGCFPVLAERRRQFASTLSGGEQQMLAIGRALMAKPRLLLLDEPSLGIAPRVIEAIFDIVVDINRTLGTTLLLVEQNTQIALAVSSRTYVLENGCIAAHGDSRKLAKSEVIRRTYMGLA